MIGQILGNYKILEQLGEGNMGSVYHALDLMLEREVALKSLRPELARRADVVERFREEARVQARLNHPNVAQMYTLFRHGDDLFMVMEFVKGLTLDQIIRQRGRLPLDEALPIFLQALDGVEHAHKAGIIHRDLKPANIMVNHDGLVKVTDFGIARVIGAARMTREGAMIGTLEYMSPERVLGKELDARSDEYSLGFVLYEMLTGNLPFSSQTEYEILRAQIETPPPPIRAAVRDIPLEVERAILKSMAKNPAERFPTVGEFSAALRRISYQIAAASSAAVVDAPPPAALPARPESRETVLAPLPVEFAAAPPKPTPSAVPAPPVEVAAPPPVAAPAPPPPPVEPAAPPPAAAAPPPAAPVEAAAPPPAVAPPPPVAAAAKPSLPATPPPPPAAPPPPAWPAQLALPKRPVWQPLLDRVTALPGKTRYYVVGILGAAILIVAILFIAGNHNPPQPQPKTDTAQTDSVPPPQPKATTPPKPVVDPHKSDVPPPVQVQARKVPANPPKDVAPVQPKTALGEELQKKAQEEQAAQELEKILQRKKQEN